ncbi:iron-containing alcohol dehydrogenase, partial [Staphylococcus aureus]|uniref:iron-containing alcohol dehydrogenase n=1 Tax=Staphylococcus aureus TaxID=1280 RepID=UPI0011A9E605
FVMTVPKSVTPDTRIHVLTHAIESYLSVIPSDYTTPFTLQPIKFTFQYLKSSLQNPHKLSTHKIHNPSTFAPIAFPNPFLRIPHSIPHKIPPEYPIPHGTPNPILLPHIIRYNA